MAAAAANNTGGEKASREPFSPDVFLTRTQTKRNLRHGQRLWRPHLRNITNETKRLIGISALVLLLAIGAGAGIARRLAPKQQPQPTAHVEQAPPALPLVGSLLPASDDVEIRGQAVCGYCKWKVGEASHNVVLKTENEPGIVFLSPNERLEKIDKMTGKCADGSIEIRARGSMTQYEDRNYLLVRNFETAPPK